VGGGERDERSFSQRVDLPEAGRPERTATNIVCVERAVQRREELP
jgi:hypothetical protein